MPKATDLAGLEAALAMAAARVGQRAILEREARKVQASARGFIGQHEAMKPRAEGPFPAWADLAQSTKDDKGRKGLPSTEMLKRTGELQASIRKRVDDDGFVVGSDDPKAIHQEFGTAKIPARSFLGRAMHRHSQGVARALGNGAVEAIKGGR